jgi:hypothetical protein
MYLRPDCYSEKATIFVWMMTFFVMDSLPAEICVLSLEIESGQVNFETKRIRRISQKGTRDARSKEESERD